MKTVAMIPVKRQSRRVHLKNFRPFAGKPLYRHFLEKMIDMPFDGIYVDTDSEIVAEYTISMGWDVIERLPELAADTANGNDLLMYEASQVEADIYFQMFVTAPLLEPSTIRKAYEVMTTELEYDSLFTAVRIFSWFWYNDRPINYDPKVLPRSQDAAPVIRETTGLYAIRREALLQEKCRIGRSPYMLFVSEVEAIDIDTEFDFQLAEFLYREIELGKLDAAR